MVENTTCEYWCKYDVWNRFCSRFLPNWRRTTSGISYPCSNVSIFCFEAFAWASIAIAACWIICCLARSVVSAAKSASNIRPLAALKLILIFVKFDKVASSLLDAMQRATRDLLIYAIAWSFMVTVSDASEAEVSSAVPTWIFAATIELMLTPPMKTKI